MSIGESNVMERHSDCVRVFDITSNKWKLVKPVVYSGCEITEVAPGEIASNM